MSRSKQITIVLFIALICAMAVNISYAFRQRENLKGLEGKEFQVEKLFISSSQIPVDQIVSSLANSEQWSSFLSKHEGFVYFSPRTGRAVSLTQVFPLIPGTGVGNNITLETLSRDLGYKVDNVTETVVKDAIVKFLSRYAGLLDINMNELGQVSIQHTSESLWNISIRRQIEGIPVRKSLISLTLKHGNLVLWGTDQWGDVKVDLKPSISASAALQSSFNYIGEQLATDKIGEPRLELIPIAPEWDGAVGKGYDYALVWVFRFEREGHINRWEVIVDAHTGELLKFEDTNQYQASKIVGSIYPLSDDECCPDGCAVTGVGAPFVNTGQSSPNDYTSINGLFNCTIASPTTTLDGRYLQIGTDSCGAISENLPAGCDVDLEGTNGEHDCTVPAGHSAGDTFASRSCIIETSFMNRQVRSWVNCTWLDNPLTCNTNIVATCNATYSGQINFYRSGGGCRNTGEIAAVFDHEWGHGVDDNCGTTGISGPGEAIADISAAVRLHNSCIGRGFWWTNDRGCGQWTSCPTNPGPSFGFNCNGYSAATECCLGCTGIREIDYAKHADADLDTISNYTCAICGAGGGTPCGRETHCEGIVPAEAGWDVAARTLQMPPFNYDKQTAFTIGDKIIWQGHQGVTNWYSCTCPSTSSGCAATNAYMQWITADDDDGNLNNGTPHMTAIFDSFDPHQISCATPTPQNNGCGSGPSQAPVLTMTPQVNGALLSWTAVPNAANYYIFKSVGIMGCDFGKSLIATVSGTTYSDEAMDCNQNNYMVQPVGSNTDCLGPTSNCISVTTPYPAPSNVTVTPTALNQLTVSWNAVSGATGYNVYRRYFVCGVETLEQIANNLSATTYVDSPVSGGLTYNYKVAAISTQCGEHSPSDWVSGVPTGDCALTPCFDGATTIVDNGTDPCGVTVQWNAGTSSCSGYPMLTYTVYKDTDPAFIPSPANQVATCVSGTSWLDSNVSYGTTYYYIVRAEDNRTGGPGPCNGGDIDSNLIRRSGSPTGPPVLGDVSWPFETGLDGWTVTQGSWTLSTARYNPGGSTASAHSSQNTDLQCDVMLSPELTPTATTQLTLYNWYNIEPQSGGYWWDRCQLHAINSSTGVRTLLTPTTGKLYKTGTWYNWSYCDAIGTVPGWAGQDTADQTWGASGGFNLAALAGQTLRLELRMFTDEATVYENIYIDDMSITNVYFPGSCTTGSSGVPGRVLDNFTVAKAGTNLSLAWQAPGGTCQPTGYGLYRGTLPWTTYNHAGIDCTITGTTTTTAQQSGSNYYLIVPLTASSEGSYGTDSSGAQIPQGSTPCHSQDLTVCN